MAENWISRAEFARFLGCTPKTISNYCESGMPCRGGGRKGNPYEIETAAAVAWYVKWESKKNGGGSYETPINDKVDYARELALEKSLDRQMKELLLEEKRGNLLDRETTEQICIAALTGVVQQIIPVGRQIIPQLKSHQNEAVALQEFETVIFAALAAASQSLSEFNLDAKADTPGEITE